MVDVANIFFHRNNVLALLYPITALHYRFLDSPVDMDTIIWIVSSPWAVTISAPYIVVVGNMHDGEETIVMLLTLLDMNWTLCYKTTCNIIHVFVYCTSQMGSRLDPKIAERSGMKSQQ